MAKKQKTPPPLSDADKPIYDAMPPDKQAQVMAISDPTTRSEYIQQWAIVQTTGQTGGTGLPSFQAGIAPATGMEQTYFEQALGTQVGRRVTTAGQIVPGTTVQVSGGPVSAVQELRGAGTTRYTPRYFERDADLLNTFGYQRIAEVQSKMVKAGLLGNNYALGRVDDATRKAWTNLLEQANRIPSPEGNTSVDWNTALNLAISQPTKGTGKLPPKVSNPADIAKVIQQVASRVLGRSADQQTVDRIVQQFQASEVASQTGALPMAGGRRVEPMDLKTLAEQKIMKTSGSEANAYRFAQFAKRLFGEASSGVQSDGGVQP